jgi:hypothetical protein
LTRREAIERGARERLVPILITAMAAGLAPDTVGARRREGRQRDSNADGDPDLVRADHVEPPEYDRRADSVLEVRETVYIVADGMAGHSVRTETNYR